MKNNEVKYIFRNKKTFGSILPDDAKLGEPFVNVFEGRLLFKGVSGGSYNSIVEQSGVFEVGSNVSNLNVYSGINVNNLFSVTGNTGQIILYQGISDFTNLFLSGTSTGFVLAQIPSFGGGNTFIKNGLNTYTGGTVSNPSVNISAASLSNLTVSGNSTLSNLTVSGSSTLVTISASTIFSAGTDLYNIFSAITNPVYFVWNIL